MTKLKKYFKNGGLRDVVELAVQFTIYLVVLGFVAGKFTASSNELREKVIALERKQECLEEIKIRLKAVEENQERILEILQGKYR